MIQTQGVHDLVDVCPTVITAIRSQIDNLSSSLTTNKGPAARGIIGGVSISLHAEYNVGFAKVTRNLSVFICISIIIEECKNTTYMNRIQGTFSAI